MIIKKIFNAFGPIELISVLLMSVFCITAIRIDYFENGLEFIPYIILPAIVILLSLRNILCRENMKRNEALFALIATIFIKDLSEGFSLGSIGIASLSKGLFLFVVPALVLLSTWKFLKENNGKNLNPDNGMIIPILFMYFLVLIF